MSDQTLKQSSELVRLARLELAVETLATWLVEAQTGFGERDAVGIHGILQGRRDEYLMLDPESNQEKSRPEGRLS